MDKQLVFVKRIEFDFYALVDDESLDDAIIKLTNFKDKIEKEYIAKGFVIGNIQISHHYDYTESYISIYREETDDEYANRIQYELEKAEKKRIKNTRKAEQARATELKELTELEELRKRVAELEKVYNG